MWTCTPWATNGSNVRRVNPNGTLSFNFADYVNGVAPACVIKRSSIAQTDTERLLECDEVLRKDWDEVYGDRMQKLVFIGQNLDKELIAKELDACLVDTYLLD